MIRDTPDMSIEDHVADLNGFVLALRLMGQGVPEFEAAILVLTDAMRGHLDRIVDISFGNVGDEK